MSDALDIGPLSWVKGEIDLALTRAAERLYDPAEHKEARASLHQAQGALAVVGVSGLAEFTAAIEAALDPAMGWSEATAEAVAEAIAALRQYLDDLLAGSPHQPLRLLRALTDLAEACGKTPPRPAELFFPDLNQRPPRREVEPPSLAPEALAARLKAARMGFARGLAKWRDDDLRGLADMRNAIAIVEQTRATPGQRAFWWIALAFLDALAAGGLEADPSELCERIEAQMAALAAGDDSLPEALLRELLYQVAVADAQSEQIEIVRGAYRLRDLVPAEVGGRRADERSPRMAAVAGLLADAEAEWGQFCAGVAAALPRFHELATLIAARAESLGPLDFARLAAAIGHIADLLRRDPLIHNDVLADEIATALLLAERAARDMAHPGGQPGADFAQQVDRATSRLNALLRGEALETLAAPSLEANAGLELELELAESVCREILVNLAEVEQALDAFFRDPAQAGGLARLALPLKQVEGALLIFNEPRAAELVRRCAHRIAYFADPAAQLSMAEFELLARDLSALGFFIEQRRHGHADLDLLLEAEGAPVTEAMAPLPATAAPTPAATTAEAAPPGRNADLVDIFIEEASDVLAELDQRLPALAAEPGNADILRVVRRGFHTLKGSSRMVSLNEFGEAAWAVEQLLNRFLADRLHVGVRLLDLLADARGFFGEWVAALAAGDFTPRPTAGLIAFCNALLTTDTQPPLVAEPPPQPPVESTAPAPVTASPAAIPTLADKVDLALLPTFLEEAAELIPRISESFRRWRLAPEDLGIAVALKRPLHTLKGSARMTGLLVLGERLHQLESQVEQSQDVAPMEAEFDAIAGEIEAMQPIQVAAPLPAISMTPPPAAAETAPLAATIAIEAAAEPGAETPAETALLRVRADRVDQLVAEAGEIAITRSRAEAEVKRLKATMGELAENVARLRSQLREIEIQAETGIAAGHQHGFGNYDQFDPLEMDRFTRFHELTRLMAESVDDVATVQQTLQRGLDDAEDALIAQSRLNRDLSVGLLRVRMVPFDSVAERLHRTVRQAAAEEGKAVRLELQGAATEIDRSVLERIVAPIEHLLRNAVAHGIEAPAQRAAAGKAEEGRILLAVSQEGHEAHLTLADDGGGLDYARIRMAAIERGLLQAAEAVDDTQLTQMIFHPGFSTARAVSAVAGRGVGMDVVRGEVTALGGRIEVSSEPGQGSSFRLHLPVTQAITPALLVTAGERRYAIPAGMVEEARERSGEEMAAIRKSGIGLGGQFLPWHYLPRLLGETDALPQVRRRHWLLLVRGGAQRLALEVDAVVGNQEIVLKRVGPQLARVAGIAGATVLGDGEIALVLNPVALAGRVTIPAVAGTVAAAPAAKPAPAPAVMVVDDSLTVRKVTGRLLERAGHRVLLAKDGVDALERLNELPPGERPGVILADIEMPRMDGFELVQTLRDDSRWADLPVIMITSRSADKHRDHAGELGVQHFLGKPYDEDELLGLIAGFLRQC